MKTLLKMMSFLAVAALAMSCEPDEYDGVAPSIPKDAVDVQIALSQTSEVFLANSGQEVKNAATLKNYRPAPGCSSK